jgi:hypothetical protein
VVLAAVGLGAAPPPRAADKVDFNRDVRPILSDNCFLCHGPDASARKAKLRLDTQDGALRKTDPIIVPGRSADSELVRRLLATDSSEVMPPPRSNKKLTPGQIDTLKRWIDQGASWGRHWAFEKPRRPPPTTVKNAGWPRNPLDAFILARLEKQGLAPSPEASRETLLRRVTLDLTGLPPTLDEIDAFLADRSPDAYDKVVARLLASPRFGERMVWEWLDAARYADSNGYQGDSERTMWPWRDWAVRALNAKLPFDQFTVWQLAGDLIPGGSRDQKLATGFLRNHMINGEGGRIAEENRVDYVMDMTETTGTVWLGLTLNCCRCHDHKFDPLLQKEYYGLFAFFNNTPVSGGGGNPQTPPVLELLSPPEEARLADARRQAAEAAGELEVLEGLLFPRDNGKSPAESAAAKDLPAEVKKALRLAPLQRNPGQLGQLAKHFAEKHQEYALRANALSVALSVRDDLARRVVRVMVMEDMPKARDTFLLQKGLYNKPGDKVSAGVPAVLPPLPDAAPRNRLALANWLVSSDNPLTARVVVNRYWQQFFGAGLVKTVEDFGVQGEQPVHPELLDWLAVDFVESGWSLEHLCRRIVTSAVYRQSSRVSPALLEADPANRLLARGPRFRLPSWLIRDQALAASGLLVEQPGGPPVNPYQPPGIWEEATFGGKRYQQSRGDDLYRRSVYTFWRRIIAPTAFFDTASRQVCTVKQSRTNIPLHALTTLNDITFVEASRALAEKVLRESGKGVPTRSVGTRDEDVRRIDLAFRRVLTRKPTAEELSVLLAGLQRLRGQFAADQAGARKLLAVGDSKRDERLDPVEHAAWTSLCNLIFNLDEALTRE